MTSKTRVRALQSAACGMLLLSLALRAEAPRAQSPSEAISYRTVFQDPGENPTQDPSLESHAIRLIEATPAGEQITFAFRDFNRRLVANALIAAHRRGVLVDGVIDGGERDRTVVKELQTELGPTRFVICGSPTFEYHSCIANSEKPSLQHNKFLTFSKLDDGREYVVLQTSMNFLEPSQLNYYNDMVEIAGDMKLYDGYVSYLFDMKQQMRSDDHYIVTDGDDGRNTIFTSPRRQPDRSTDDIIVDRLNEVDCSEGGSSSGKGLIRIANMAFRTERAVIMRKLVALKDDGCDIEVVVSNADGDIMAGLVSAGIPVHPFFLRALGTTRPQVIVHSKFWLVDAKSTDTGSRSKVVFAGSSNWRGDQQRSDDLLLRIVDDGVYSDYSDYWELIKQRAKSDLPRPATDAVRPSSALRATPRANAAGWNKSDVTVRVAGSDGHLQTASGLKRLHVELSGAQTGAWDFLGETAGYNIQELVISAEGETAVTFFSEDNRDNVEAAKSYVVRIDKSAPTFAGLPRACVLWPPNNQFAHVADVSGMDAVSGLLESSVAAWSDADDDEGDIVISGGSVELRAEKDDRGGDRTYSVRAAATDLAGNTGTAVGTCAVPHSQGAGDSSGEPAAPTPSS
jgi:hypothetical protein